MTLSTRDKDKPFILVGAAAAGLALPHFIGEPVPTLLYVTQIGVFLVILAVIRRRQCRQAPQSRYLIGRASPRHPVNVISWFGTRVAFHLPKTYESYCRHTRNWSLYITDDMP